MLPKGRFIVKHKTAGYIKTYVLPPGLIEFDENKDDAYRFIGKGWIIDKLKYYDYNIDDFELIEVND